MWHPLRDFHGYQNGRWNVPAGPIRSPMASLTPFQYHPKRTTPRLKKPPLSAPPRPNRAPYFPPTDAAAVAEAAPTSVHPTVPPVMSPAYFDTGVRARNIPYPASPSGRPKVIHVLWARALTLQPGLRVRVVHSDNRSPLGTCTLVGSKLAFPPLIGFVKLIFPLVLMMYPPYSAGWPCLIDSLVRLIAAVSAFIPAAFCCWANYVAVFRRILSANHKR